MPCTDGCFKADLEALPNTIGASETGLLPCTSVVLPCGEHDLRQTMKCRSETPEAGAHTTSW